MWQNNALSQPLAGQQHLANSGGGGQGGDGSAVGDDGAAAGEALSDAHASAHAPSFPVLPPPAALLLQEAPGPVAHLASSGAGTSSKGKAAGPVKSLSHVLAKVHFGDRMAAGGGAPPLSAQHGTLSNDIYRWFGGLATKLERALLLPPLISQPVNPQELSGQRRVLLTKLHSIVVARLIDLFPSNEVPKGLNPKWGAPPVSLGCSSIQEYKKKLKKLKVVLDESPEAFRAFRLAFDAGSSSSSSSSAGGDGGSGAAGGADSAAESSSKKPRRER